LRVIFSSNEAPKLDNTEANKRRAIICTLSKIKGEKISETVYEKMLMDEAEFFINAAVQAYEKSGMGHIHCDQSVLEDYAATMHSEIENLFEKYFEDDPIGHVQPIKMEEILQKERTQGVDIAGFRDWLVREKGVRKQKVTTGEMGEFGYKLGYRVYRGIRLKKHF
jgi:hypothetical protein